MQMRYRAAATALLLTATAGLAATGGAAEATGTHHTSSRAASRLVVTVKTTASGMSLSEAKIRPGNTLFKVAPHGKGGTSVQMVRLRAGYSLTQAFSDINAAFGGDVKAVRRVDKNMVFYGGASVAAKGTAAQYWGVKVDKRGTYYFVNTETNALTSLKVKGTTQKRSLPKTDGWLNAATVNNGAGNQFKVGKHDANRGWMKTTNNAQEPHFFDLGHVKKSTKPSDVSAYLSDPNAPQVPPFQAKDGAQAAQQIVSPGKTVVWSYRVPKGKYLVTCFWPSKFDGMPHALMGMWKLFHLG